MLVERTATGGQAGQSSRIENYLGFPDGVSGAQLTERARRQATKFGAELLTTRDVVGLDVNGSARTRPLRRRRHRSTRTRSSWPPGFPTGSSARRGLDRADRARRLLRVHADRGGRLRGPGRLHRRRRELRRARPRSTWPSTPRSVTTPGAAGRRWSGPCPTTSSSRSGDGINIVGPHLHRGDQPPRASDHLERLTLRDTHRPAQTETVERAAGCSVFIGAAPLTDWLDGVVARDARGFVAGGPGPAPSTAARPRGWDLDRAPVPPGDERPRRVRGRRRARGVGQAGRPRRSARARWRSCSCTDTSREL